MKVYKKIFACLVCIIISHSSILNAQTNLCYPISFKSLTPGLTLNQDVFKLFGAGYFDKEDGAIGS